MTNIRTRRAADGQFLQILNSAMQDDRLTLEARGMLAFILSLPPDTPITVEWLTSHLPHGRDLVRRVLRELETCGYYRRVRGRTHGRWDWVKEVSDAPQPAAEPSSAHPTMGPTCGNAASPQVAPWAESPTLVAQPIRSKDVSTKKDSLSRAAQRVSDRLRTAGATPGERELQILTETLESSARGSFPAYLRAICDEDLLFLLEEVQVPAATGQAHEAAQLTACDHGEPGGAQIIPSTGKPRCPLCRAQQARHAFMNDGQPATPELETTP